jgi:hypothetical protein
MVDLLMLRAACNLFVLKVLSPKKYDAAGRLASHPAHLPGFTANTRTLAAYSLTSYRRSKSASRACKSAAGAGVGPQHALSKTGNPELAAGPQQQAWFSNFA